MSANLILDRDPFFYFPPKDETLREVLFFFPSPLFLFLIKHKTPKAILIYVTKANKGFKKPQG